MASTSLTFTHTALHRLSPSRDSPHSNTESPNIHDLCRSSSRNVRSRAWENRHRLIKITHSSFGSELVSVLKKSHKQVITNAALSQAVEYGSKLSISECFSKLREKGEIAVIPFIVAGDPCLETSARALLELDQCGADIIELGVPYSDPLADGPVIHAAATRALSKGTTLQSVLTMLKQVSPKIRAPVVLFTYYNPILKKGLETFMREVKESGASGLVVPDIPLEETPPLRKMATEFGLELVLLTTPTTPNDRMASIAEATQGFLYLVSLTGVTGTRVSVQGRVQHLLSDIKKATDKPVAVGFGISQPVHATQVVEWGADGVIIGSALVKLLENSSPDEGIAAITSLVRSLKDAVTPPVKP